MHPNSNFFVEFPPGPLSVGSERIEAKTEIKIHGQRLKLLSPTESVMDRLAAYFFWNDRQGLDQALWISEKHPVKMDRVRAWSKKEGALEKFEEFLALHRARK